MSIGIGQVLIILLLGILLFGNAPKIIKDLGHSVGAGILEVRSAMKTSTEGRTQVDASQETTGVSVEPTKRQLTEASTAMATDTRSSLDSQVTDSKK